MKEFPHTHPCHWCGKPVDCDGDLEHNYDGEPDVVCRAYHVYGGDIRHVLCEECDAKVEEPEEDEEE